ncbi:MAG: hypothetical protein LUF30_00315, partial [Lachnospiraceae bacterium]|nr:hypothetical protein [Lachnospiraceae bacterium]
GLLLVPSYGIIGYQCGILCDQLLLTICMSCSLRRKGLLTVSIPGAITRSLLPTIVGGCAACLFSALARAFTVLPSYALLFAGALFYCIGYLLIAFCLQASTFHFGRR